MTFINHSLRAQHLGRRLIIDGKPFVGGICLHDTAGSGTHNDTRYLANPSDGRKVSVDFTVERDGSIWQLNPDLDRNCTFHAGRATKWKAKGRVFQNQAVTQVLIGIELTQKSDLSKSPIWPDEQVKAVADLCVHLCDRYGLTKEQITTHENIIQDGSRTDPRKFPFVTFWNRFNRTAAGAAIDPNPPATVELSKPVVYTVKIGDSLWKIAKQFATSIEDIKSLNNMSTASTVIRPGQNLIVKR